MLHAIKSRSSSLRESLPTELCFEYAHIAGLIYLAPGTTEGTLPSPFRSAEGQPKGAPARSLARSPALPFSPEAAAIKRLINKAGYRFCRHFSRKSIFLQPMSFKTIAFTFLWNACTCTYTRRHVQNVKKQEGHVLLEPAAPMFHLLIFGNVSLKTVLLLIGKFSLT